MYQTRADSPRLAGYVLVLAGDHIYRMDYGRSILAAHVARQADVTLACMEVPASDAERLPG